MKKVCAYTLGCKVNQYDTIAMLELLQKAGYQIVQWGQTADVYLINTCTVTNTADKKSRNMIRRAVKQNPNALVCVCGCLAQDKADELLGMEGVGTVVGTDERLHIVQVVEAGLLGKAPAALQEIGKIERFEELEVHSGGEKTRGYIKIQEGCNNFCSYCIIPHVRGRERSRDTATILAEAQTLAQNGVCEIVLTGIHISAFKDEKGNGLLPLLQQLNEIEGILRIRLGSLEPHIIKEEFVSGLCAVEKLCPHFHVALQSGCDIVLKRMNRKYTTKDYLRHIALLRKYYKNPAITTDIITGFPGEDDAAFAETCEFVRKVAFARIHVFPYSEREGTPASKMQDSVPVHLRKERARQLIAIGEQTEAAYLDSFLGSVEMVLFELANQDVLEGYTSRYSRVQVPNEGVQPGESAAVLIKNRENDILMGNLV